MNTLDCGSDANCLAFSPDDSLLASGHNDSIIRLWNLSTGQLRGELLAMRVCVTRHCFFFGWSDPILNRPGWNFAVVVGNVWPRFWIALPTFQPGAARQFLPTFAVCGWSTPCGWLSHTRKNLPLAPFCGAWTSMRAELNYQLIMPDRPRLDKCRC